MSPISQNLQHLLGWSGGGNVAISLLEHIDNCGLINKAAKTVEGLNHIGVESTWFETGTFSVESVTAKMVEICFGDLTTGRIVFTNKENSYHIVSSICYVTIVSTFLSSFC